ncbi:heme oxygenase (biliverdin-producing) [Aeromicrobium sp. CF4.19]|uniref:biliverdin-producing heme oxygenase n=1 Tax=Aeromicrobium sp. CF4.19 TaxID=3373082 RepID=UPI003EE53D7A
MTLAAHDERTTPLSALLRAGSQQEHREAESSSFMSELVAGRVSPAGYAHYLSCLRSVYAALESVAVSLVDDPIAGRVLDPDLDRLATIDADLAVWGAASGEPSPATQAYVDQVLASAAWGGLFVAHHYTRYLGDLSGGQVIGRVLSREYDLEPGVGVAFYRFEAIAKPKPYKDRYRATLDALPLDEHERVRVLDEVKAVFGLNGALFAELTERLPQYRR